MLVRLCAWHRGYFGYAKLLGLKRDGAWRWTTSHGLCEACGAVQRARYGLRATTASASVGREIWRAAVALSCLVVYAALVLVLAAGCDAFPSKRVTAEDLRESIGRAQRSDAARGSDETAELLRALDDLNECFAWLEGVTRDFDAGRQPRPKDLAAWQAMQPPVCQRVDARAQARERAKAAK